MVDCSSLVENVKVKNDENIVEKFPYRILNDLSKKLKNAEVTIAKILAERKALEDVKNEEVKNYPRE